MQSLQVIRGRRQTGARVLWIIGSKATRSSVSSFAKSDSSSSGQKRQRPTRENTVKHGFCCGCTCVSARFELCMQLERIEIYIRVYSANRQSLVH